MKFGFISLVEILRDSFRIFKDSCKFVCLFIYVFFLKVVRILEEFAWNIWIFYSIFGFFQIDLESLDKVMRFF